MAISLYDSFQANKARVLGTGGGVTTATKPATSATFESFQQNKTRVLSQPKPTTQPIAPVQAPQPQPNILQELNTGLRNLDLNRIKTGLISSIKSLPGTLKTSAGIIIGGLSRQQQQMETFFISPTEITRRLTGVNLRQGTREIEQKIAEVAREKGEKEKTEAFEPYRKLGPTENKVQKYAELITVNAPQLVLNTALTLGTAVVTKNPSLAAAVGLSSSYGLFASEVYSDARQEGKSDKEAMPLAALAGFIGAPLDFLPIGRLLRKTGALEPIKRSLIQNISKQIVSIGIQAGFEGVTEGLQEIVSNAARATYKENQDLLEGVKESVFVGAILGGFSEVTVDSIFSIKGKSTEEAFDQINQKVDEAIATPESKRTEEQAAIVDAVTKTELSPDEALGAIIENGIENTPLGKELAKMAVENKGTDKVIVVDTLKDKVTVHKPDDILVTRQEKIDYFESQLQERLTENRQPVEEALVHIFAEMEIAEAGRRIFIPSEITSESEVKAIESTFPSWVPEDLRSKDLFDKVLGPLNQVLETGKYPEGTKTRQRALYDAILDEVDSRAKTDTKALRSAILEAYEEKAIQVRAPQEPVSGGPERGKEPTTTKEVTKAKETPVGTGRIKESRLFKRVKETLGVEQEARNVTYNELSLDKQASAVAELIEEDSVRAARIARGLEEPPAGMTQNAVAVGLASLAETQSDFATASELWSKTSLRSTRLGQEIVSLRGDVTTNIPLNAVKQVVNFRVEQLAKRYKNVIDGLNLPEDTSTGKKVDAIVKKEVEAVKKEVTQQQSRVQSAQEIINSLIC